MSKRKNRELVFCLFDPLINIYILINLYIYIYYNNIKMSINDFFKNTFLKPVIFQFIQEPSQDCAVTETVKTISNLNNPKIQKEKLKIE